MTVTPSFHVRANQAESIKKALGFRCEMCHARFSSRHLLLHNVCGDEMVNGDRERDLEKQILVLCELCHDIIHALPQERSLIYYEKKLIRDRPKQVKKDIQKILGYVPKPYTPPDSDLAELFEEAQSLHGGFRVV